MIIDGSIGGGSVLRVAAPLALARGYPITIYNIRANRKKPGLRTQHLLGLNLLAQLAGCKLEGGDLGSTEVTLDFHNANKKVQDIHLNISTAASVSLILQMALNYSIASEKDISFTFTGGGTYTEWSPNLTYCTGVLSPLLEKIGISLDIHIEKHGYYPKGGAKGRISIHNSGLCEFNFVSSTLTSIHLSSNSSTLLKQAKVAERQINGFEAKFGDSHNIEKEITYYDTIGAGSALTAILHYDSGISKGVSCNGKKGLPAEKVGKIVADKVSDVIMEDAAVDEYMADQLLISLSVLKKSSFTVPAITEHVKVNVDIIKLVTGIKILYEHQNGVYRIYCE